MKGSHLGRQLCESGHMSRMLVCFFVFQHGMVSHGRPRQCHGLGIPNLWKCNPHQLLLL